MSRALREWTGWQWTLAAVLATALAIRLWGTWYGLPFSYYSDEYHEVMRALELGMGKFNFDRFGKGGFYFVLFFEYAVYYGVLRLTGAIASTQEFAEQFVRDPGMFYLLGRITAAFVGTACVAVVFLVGRAAYSTVAGLLAAAFLALNTLHSDLSRLVGVDVPMTMLAMAALLFAVRVAEQGRRSDYLWAAVFAALATTTKVTAILLVVPLLIAHTYAVARHPERLRGWWTARELWYAFALFWCVLIVTEPAIFGAVNLVSLFAGQDADTAAVAEATDAVVNSRDNLFVFYALAMRDSMGLPMFAAALAAAGFAAWKRTAADVILLSYAALNFVVIASTTSSNLYYPRYSLPIVIVLLILLGRGVAALGAPTARSRFALAAVVALLVALPVRQAAATLSALSEDDTRTQAKAWFEDHVPPGARVAIEGLKIGPIKSTVQLAETPAAMQRRVEHWKAVEPRQARFLELQIAVSDGAGYDLELIRDDAVASVDEYAARGVEYFVVRPDALLGGKAAAAGGRRLLGQLRTDPRVTLLKHFEAGGFARLSPAIEIYQLRKTPL
jgi:4-amino-4-deoxy-L-arabinose transferase-like glycosyltransferase